MTAPWGKVLAEFNKALADHGPTAADALRQQKVEAVTAVTRRPLVVYATACTTLGKPIPEFLLMIEPSDKLGMHEVTGKIGGSELDVLVHSPGGIPDATDAIVQLLRDRFAHIRFIVPFYAKSAATMLVLSGNEILMMPPAELGPIDPQMQVILPNGVVMYSPAYALKEQYERAQREVNQDAGRLPGWIATLSHPSRLVECELAIDRARRLVQGWLEKYMFAGDSKAAQKAEAIASYLSSHEHFLSHAYPIRLGDPRLSEAKIRRVADADQALEAAIWELYCAIDLTFQNTGAVKIFENNLTPPDRVVRGIEVKVQLQAIPSPGMPTTVPKPPAAAARRKSPKPKRHKKRRRH